MEKLLQSLKEKDKAFQKQEKLLKKLEERFKEKVKELKDIKKVLETVLTGVFSLP